MYLLCLWCKTNPPVDMSLGRETSHPTCMSSCFRPSVTRRSREVNRRGCLDRSPLLLRRCRPMFQEEVAFRTKMRLVLNEWVAATIQLHFGKATPENDGIFHAFLREVVPLEVIFGKDALKMDPLEKLHPLEVTGGRDGRGFPGDAIDRPFRLSLLPRVQSYNRSRKNEIYIGIACRLSCPAASFDSGHNVSGLGTLGPNPHQDDSEFVVDDNTMTELYFATMTLCALLYTASALDGWKSDGLANLSKTPLYQDIKRLADRCRAVFGCLDMEYDIDDIVLDYVIYRWVLLP